uniref:Uncharacterized protein n=1 Tax=Arundo donax TaxID=35708 RepID=A0A0A8ZC74_ARUDO
MAEAAGAAPARLRHARARRVRGRAGVVRGGRRRGPCLLARRSGARQVQARAQVRRVQADEQCRRRLRRACRMDVPRTFAVLRRQGEDA